MGCEVYTRNILFMSSTYALLLRLHQLHHLPHKSHCILAQSSCFSSNFNRASNYNSTPTFMIVQPSLRTLWPCLHSTHTNRTPGGKIASFYKAMNYSFFIFSCILHTPTLWLCSLHTPKISPCKFNYAIV